MSRHSDVLGWLAGSPVSDPALGDASCAGHGDPDLWFADNRPSRDWASEICMDCPLRLRCLEYAIRNGEVYGVWGGIDFTRSTKKMRRLVAAEEGIDLDG